MTLDPETEIRMGLQDALDPDYYERFLDELVARLSDAESLNRKHDTETTSIHADMLALAALVGVHYDGVSSPAGFLHAAIMPAVTALTARLGELERTQGGIGATPEPAYERQGGMQPTGLTAELYPLPRSER